MTNSKTLSTVLMALVALLLAAPGFAQKKDKPAPKAKPVMVSVVQVDGDYRVVKKEELATLKKELKAEHKEALARHKQAAADARKNKEKFKEPAPKAKKLKVVKPSIDEAKADAFIEALKAKAAKKSAPKERRKAPKKAKKKNG